MAQGLDASFSVRPDSPLVLIVEDDRETRQFYQTVLSAQGFRTEEAHNGFQALEKATEKLPDLVITDIAVPGLDGIELCRRLRGSAKTRQIPVLAVTGYPDRHYEARATEAGADRLLIKPCPPDVLVHEVRALLALRSNAPAR
jgi:DNA-binding response OmpR family regulator